MIHSVVSTVTMISIVTGCRDDATVRTLPSINNQSINQATDQCNSQLMTKHFCNDIK